MKYKEAIQKAALSIHLEDSNFDDERVSIAGNFERDQIEVAADLSREIGVLEWKERGGL